MSRTLTFCIVTLSASLSGSALGLSYDIDAIQQSTFTTNTARSEDDAVTEWVHAPGIAISAQQQGNELHLDLGYRHQARLRQRSIYGNENTTTGRGTLTWYAFPGLLDLTLSDVRTESTIRATDAFTPDNRQVISFTRFGPTLRTTPRPGDELSLELNHSNVVAEETDTDSSRNEATLRYVLGIAPKRNLAVAVSRKDVDFDNPAAPDLEVSRITATFASRNSRLTSSITGGRAQIRQRRSGRSFSHTVYDLSLD